MLKVEFAKKLKLVLAVALLHALLALAAFAQTASPAKFPTASRPLNSRG
jgi:hypothetical protein